MVASASDKLSHGLLEEEPLLSVEINDTHSVLFWVPQNIHHQLSFPVY